MHRKPVSSILPPESYRSADHRTDRHPANPDGKVLFKDGDEWWLDLCRIGPGEPIAILDGHHYSACVFPDGALFEWNQKAYEVMGHDRRGARLWIREFDGELDIPTTADRPPELRRTA